MYRKKYFPEDHFLVFFVPFNKSFIDQAFSVKTAGYWPRSFFARLWTSTTSQSITGQETSLTNLNSLSW